MILIPTTSQIYTDSLNALEAQFNAIINPVGKAELRAQSAVQAGQLTALYLSISNLLKNIWVDTCDEPTLIRFGLVKINRMPFQAVAGQYTVTVTGTIGGVIPVNSVWKSDDSALNPGILYILDEEHTMLTTSDSIVLRSLTLGLDSKLNIGDTLTATSPIPLVNSSATVVSEYVQPLAAEDIEDYRSIIIDSFRLEAQGGAGTDYRIWSADVQSVEKVYPYAKSGYANQIDLFVEAKAADSTDGKGTPSQMTLDEVEEVVNFSPDTTLPLNERGRRPLQVIVNYLPVTIQTVVITITGLQGLTPTLQTNLLTQLTAEINSIRPFVASADDLASKNDILNNNKLGAVIYNTSQGAIYTSVSFTVDAVSYLSYTFEQGNIPYLNPTIIYV